MPEIQSLMPDFNLSSVLGWLGIGGLASFLAFWAFGGTALLNVLASVSRIAASLSEALAPALKDALSAAVAGVIWFGKSVLWEGLKDIFDAWVTIVTVVCMGLLLWGYIRASEELRLRDAQMQVNACVVELKKAKKSLAVQPKQITRPAFLWPWE